MSSIGYITKEFAERIEAERQQAIDERDAALERVEKLEHQLSKNRLSPEEYQAMIAAPYKRAAGVPDPTMDDA